MKYTFIFIILFSLVSCEKFLDVPPKNEVEVNNFYKTPEDSELALTAVYNSLQERGTYNDSYMFYFCNDVTKPASWDQSGFVNYKIFADNSIVEDIWQDHYKGINEANTVIYYTGLLDEEDFSSPGKQQIINEARFIRTLLYFNLVRIYKDVPKITTPTLESSEIEVSQYPEDLMYQFLLAEVDTCIKYLDYKVALPTGTASKEAAMALAADINMTWGSRLKYLKNDLTLVSPAPEEAVPYFQRALSLSDSIINSGTFELVPYYPDVFTAHNRNNREIIFDVQFLSKQGDEGSKGGNNVGLTGPNNLGGSGGSITSTRTYNDGIFTVGSDSVRSAWNTVICDLVDRELFQPNNQYPQQMSQEIIIPGEQAMLVIWKKTISWKQARIGKWRNWPIRSSDYVFGDTDMNWPIYRLGEMLLLYIEAYYELNGTFDAVCYERMNMLRRRASRTIEGGVHYNQLPRKYRFNPEMTKEFAPGTLTMQIVRTERAKELGGELKRWFDLVRWGILQKTIKDLGAKINNEGLPLEGGNWGDDIQDYHNFMPIPHSEILANKNLIQNEGYY